MEGPGEDEVFHISEVIGEETPKERRGLHPPPCLTFEEEFIALRLRQKLEMKRKIAEGDFVPKYRTEEEKYSICWKGVTSPGPGRKRRG
jgi:hypothetical protein